MGQSKSSKRELPEMLSRVSGLAKLALRTDSSELRESIDIYLFLQSEFQHCAVTDNRLFQFVYRSFYRIDNAGLLPRFHSAYFKLMEKSRGEGELDLKALTLKLYPILNRKNRPSRLSATLMMSQII